MTYLPLHILAKLAEAVIVIVGTYLVSNIICSYYGSEILSGVG
jgi:hypothetical protein